VLRLFRRRAEMQLAYDLRKDMRHIKHVQKATLETERYGIVQDHGLFGSEDWWQAIQSGALPVQTIKGRISRVYMSGHNDFPEFEVDDGARKTSWERRGKDSLYIVERMVQLDCVGIRSRFDREWRLTPIRIWVGRTNAAQQQVQGPTSPPSAEPRP